MAHCNFRWSILIIALLGFVMPLQGGEPNAAFSISIDEFCRLSLDDQKTFLLNALESRLEHAKNIHYEALTLGNVSEYEDGRVGKMVTELNGSRLQHWRMGKSFRMDTDRGGADVSKPERSVQSGFDSMTGIFRGTTWFADDSRKFGRIGVVADRIIEFNRYMYWLDGEHTVHADFIIRYLVDHLSESTILCAEDRIRISTPWYVYGNEKPWGTRDYTLDPQKGFLPVQGTAFWTNRPGSWRREEFFVDDSRLIGDVWMPTKLTEVIGTSSFQNEHLVNVYETTVSAIEFGKVTAADIEVPFPPGMEVVDAIAGEAYVVGPDHGRTNVERLVGESLALEKKTSVRSNGVIFINLGLGVLVITFLLWKYASKRRSSV